ncbi:MAG: outer membrane beta-barrel protein [Opitutus sp.]|nr:outer membrane beta-barrel protein [Opitutus sp.]
MTFRVRWLLLLSVLVGPALPHAFALFTLNQGKDLVFVSASYSIGWDSNVFTRQASQASFTQSASASIDYTRQAGLISVTANASAALGMFQDVSGQDFVDPSFAVAFRKRYGRTTGALTLHARHESQPDPDAGQRTESWFLNSNLDLRYPINDRFYLSNSLGYGERLYSNKQEFSDLATFSEGFYANFVYSSKLDLNSGYSLRISETSRNTTAYDHSLTIGAQGGILPKLSGTIRFGVQRRYANSSVGGREDFDSFTSGTTLKWLYSRRLTFNADLNQDFSTTSTDISTNRFSAGLRATSSISSKFIVNAGVTYSITNFLGEAGEGRRDEMLQFDTSVGWAFTTHVRMNLSYVHTINWSNVSSATFVRDGVTLSIIATY